MSRELSVQDIHDILHGLKLFAEGERLLIVGADGDAATCTPVHNVIRLGRVASANDICETTRVDVSVVVDQIEHMSKDDGAHLLSRLRDLVSNRVLLVLGGNEWAADELLAIGYQEIGSISEGKRCYLFDPDLFYQPRAWNNASGYANPENYGKFRW